jgi:hypothetical protein
VALVVAGERLAARVSAAQARLAPRADLARALAAQARQERHHVRLAEGLAQWSGEDRAGAQAALRELESLGALLAEDLGAGRFADSLCGLQGVLDPLGEAMLEHLAQSRHPAARVLAPVARRVLAQERGHHALGAKAFRQVGLAGSSAPSRYAEIGSRLARRAAELQEGDEAKGALAWQRVESKLSTWAA